MSVLGLDIGPNLCRGLAINASGGVAARVQRRYAASSTSGDCQLDARTVWEAVRKLIAQAADLTRQDPITALAISASGEAVVPLSLEGQPLMPCILGGDVRGAGYAEQVRALLGVERFYDLTGRLGGQTSLLNILCWIRDHAPGVYRETARFCTLGGYIAYQLGVSSATDRTQASATHLLDVNQADWSDEVLRACDLAAAKMPEVRPAGTPLGPVAGATCRELGLSGRPLAVLGADDLACAAIGAGVVRPGQTLYHLGSQLHLAPLYEATPIRRLLYLRGLETWQHLPVGLLTSPVRYAVGGNALSWFLDVLSPLERREALRAGRNPYDLLLGEMPAEPAGPMVMPGDADHLGGVAVGLGLNTSRGELVRALLEGLALQTLAGQQSLLEVGIAVESYRATGGGSRSARWLQIAADVMGLPLERTGEEQSAALGAAIIAAAGVGLFADLASAADALVRVVDRYEPDPARHAHYLAREARFRGLQTPPAQEPAANP